MADFERERKRVIVDLWRDGMPFDEIREYVGMGPEDVARVILRVLNMPRWINPYGLTMGEIAEAGRHRREVPRLAIGDAAIIKLLPGVTTRHLRARLISSLSASSHVADGALRRGC